MENGFPVRGHVVRLSYNDFDALSTFYHIMREEASAVSRMENEGPALLKDVFYWQGAVVTNGAGEDGCVIEIQNGSTRNLDRLVRELRRRMGVEFEVENVNSE